MPRKESEIKRLIRLSAPPRDVYSEACRAGVGEAEAVLDAWWQEVLAAGDPWFYYGARAEYVRLYAIASDFGHRPADLQARVRRAVEDLQKYEPPFAGMVLSVARMVYQTIADPELAMRLIRQGRELAVQKEAIPEEHGIPQSPDYSLALRAELAILADIDPTGQRAREIIRELADREDVAARSDFDREETTSKLIAAGVRDNALRALLLNDRQAIWPRKRGEQPPEVRQIDAWLAQLDSP